MAVSAVIGAAYGDEGKGHVTAALAGPGSIVCRMNGSSQAGHTVVSPSGDRAVFSHAGSGTMAGARTYLGPRFVCNPAMFQEEWAYLYSYHPEILVHPDCPVTTPWDVIINRLAEQARGDKRHGSVGAGFGETLERHGRGYPLAVKDLPVDKGNCWLKSHLINIIRQWVPLRCSELNIDLATADKDLTVLLTNPDMLEIFLGHCVGFRRKTYVKDVDWLCCRIRKGTDVIFEGAQGLMLDQTEGFFPHVTRSNTGLKNICEVLPDCTPLQVYYVTRAYTTRHGAGPFPHELPEGLPFPIVDETNVPGKYQGTLRFSFLNLDTLLKAIGTDIRKHGQTQFTYNLVITCLDQLPGMNLWHDLPLTVILNDKQEDMTVDKAMSFLKKELKLNEVLFTASPSDRLHSLIS